jgi:hypothetical protein
MVVLPLVMPETTPPATVATALFVLDHTPPLEPLAVSVALVPIQKAASPVMMPGDESGFTDTVTVAVLVHSPGVYPVTV